MDGDMRKWTAMLGKMRAALGNLGKGHGNKDKKNKLILVLGLSGMVILLVAQWVSPQHAKPAAQPDTAAVGENQALYTPEEYGARIEKKLGDMLNRIQGVGQVHIMVTLENSGEYVYALEEKRNWDKNISPDSAGGTVNARENIQQSYILVDAGYGQKEPLVRTRLEPKIQGVVVVCQGAGDIRVRQSIVNVVVTALHISSTRVCVEQAMTMELPADATPK